MPKNKLFSDRKGQGAMEYLTTYGWAILVVMVVGMVLYQLGVFNSSSGSTFADFYYLKPMSAAIGYSSSGSFQAAFQNTVGTSIQILSATTFEEISETNCTINQVNEVSMPAEISVAAGELFTVTSTCAPRTKGEPYKAAVTINYRAIARDIATEHTENGTISGTVE
jgi:hypothetical protein